MTWVDELVGKRDDVGADKAVAVSGAGFSRAAKTAARAQGIALRTLEEVTDQDVLDWVRMSELHVFRRGFRPRRLQIQVVSGDSQPSFSYDHRTRCLRRKSDGAMLCVEDIWNLAQDQVAPIYEAMWIAGIGAKDVSVLLQLPPGGFEVDATSSSTDVGAVLVEGTMTLDRTSTPVVRREYVSDDGVLMRVAEAEAALEDRRFVISIQEKAAAGGGSPERVVKLYQLPDE